MDVVLDPFQGEPLIVEPSIRRAAFLKCWSREPPKGSESVIEAYVLRIELSVRICHGRLAIAHDDSLLVMLLAPGNQTCRIAPK